MMGIIFLQQMTKLSLMITKSDIKSLNRSQMAGKLQTVFLVLALSLCVRAQLYFSLAETISTRLHPNEDIMTAITKSFAPYQLTALSVASAVGSVRYCYLRLANNSYLTKVDGPLQITSLSGTIDYKMQPHIHIQLANGKGQSIGGHLPSLEERSFEQGDCPIFTTLQIVFLSHEELIYERKIDPQTTFHELYIRRRTNRHQQ